MKISKKILLCSILLYIVIIILKINIKVDVNYTSLEGYIRSIKIDDNKVTIVIKNKERLIGTYYINDDEYTLINNLKLNDYIKLEGNIYIPSKNTNFNLFNYQNYLKSLKIYKCVSIKNITLIKSNNNLVYKIKNSIINRINTYNSKDYMYAFILGNKDYIDKDIYSSYSTNGVSHLFAISGMHVSLLSTIILYILNKIKRKSSNYIVVIIFLLFYSYLTDFSPSIIRSFLLFTFIFINKKYNLKIKNDNILLIIILLMILYNPFYIYSLGFKFSISISYFLIKFSSLINKHKNYFVKLFYTSVISNIVSIPIISTCFYKINLLSILCNMIILPLVSIIIFPLCLLSFLLKPLDNILLYFTNILQFTSAFLQKISISINLPHVNIIVVILYYILIYLMFKYKYKIFKLLFILMFIIHMNINYIIRPLSIHFIDVGQGDCILIRLENKNILVDTGGKLSSKTDTIAKNTIIPYLNSLGIKKLDYIILTHGDYDHLGESIYLINNFKVDKVLLNSGSNNKYESSLISILNTKNIPYKNVSKGNLKINNYTLEFINKKNITSENDDSLVIYANIKGIKILLTGDIGKNSEYYLKNTYNIKDIDILKVAHHGSKTSSSKEFIYSINPKYSVISVGKNNRYGHPNNEVLENLNDSKIYRTDIDGGIMFKIKNGKLEIETCIPQKGESDELL